MSKKKTIHTNPLDAVIPDRNGSIATLERSAEKPLRKERLTMHIPIDLINRVKNCVYWNPKLNLARFGEQALLDLIEYYERENGGPYRQREEELRGGRPMK